MQGCSSPLNTKFSQGSIYRTLFVKYRSKNGLTAKVKVEIAVPASVMALISKEAVDDLGIKVGDQVEAVVRTTEVMIDRSLL